MISYKHEPFVDFTNEENKKAYQEALQTVEGYLGQDYPLYIGAEKVTTDEKIVSYNPADKQPYGLDWYGYFMRRLAERPSNIAFAFKGMVRS